MSLIRLVPNGEGSEVHTFECAKCGVPAIVELPDPRLAAARLIDGSMFYCIVLSLLN